MYETVIESIPCVDSEVGWRSQACSQLYAQSCYDVAFGVRKGSHSFRFSTRTIFERRASNRILVPRACARRPSRQYRWDFGLCPARSVVPFRWFALSLILCRKWGIRWACFPVQFPYFLTTDVHCNVCSELYFSNHALFVLILRLSDHQQESQPILGANVL